MNEGELPVVAPAGPWLGRQGCVWIALGLCLIVTLFLPLYTILNESIQIVDLAKALNKDMVDVAKMIGEFTTFLMYLGPVLSLVCGVWVLVAGVKMAGGGKAGWVLPAVLAGATVLVYLLCASRLNSKEAGMFFFGKFMPEPAYGFYLEILWLGGVIVSGASFAWLGRK